MNLADNIYNTSGWVGDPPYWEDRNYTYKPITQRVKKVTRTIEKYNESGELISREIITEEEEFYDKQVWPSTDIIISSGGTTANCENIPTTTDKTIVNPDTPYTLTNGMSVGAMCFAGCED